MKTRLFGSAQPERTRSNVPADLIFDDHSIHVWCSSSHLIHGATMQIAPWCCKTDG
jgi:hypothetical protein